MPTLQAAIRVPLRVRSKVPLGFLLGVHHATSRVTTRACYKHAVGVMNTTGVLSFKVLQVWRAHRGY